LKKCDRKLKNPTYYIPKLCPCIIYTVEGEKKSKLQAVSEGSSKVVATPVEYSTNEIIDGSMVC